MKIIGEIDVFIKEGDVIVDHIHTTNTFTDAGKQHVCNWLLHDNYSTDIITSQFGDAGGRSLSNKKIVPYNQVTCTNVNGHSYSGGATPGLNILYPNNSDWNNYISFYDDNYYNWSNKNWNYGAIYFEFSEPKKIVGMMIRQGDNQAYRHHASFSIAVSSSSFDYLNPDTPYTHVQHGVLTNAGNEQMTREQYYNFYDNTESFGIYGSPLENVKTLRYAIRYEQYNAWDKDWNHLYGIWFFEENFYPNTPSVLSLGTGNTTPTTSDTALEAENNRGWMTYVNLEANNKVRYSRHIKVDEANDVLFKEIGLMACPDNGRCHGGSFNGPDIATTLFARAVFDTPWQKTLGQSAEISYTLTLI